MATKIQLAAEKFKKGQKVKTTLGRGSKHVGKVIAKEDDGYLSIEFRNPDDKKAKPRVKRVNPMGCKAVAA